MASSTSSAAAAVKRAVADGADVVAELFARIVGCFIGFFHAVCCGCPAGSGRRSTSRTAAPGRLGRPRPPSYFSAAATAKPLCTPPPLLPPHVRLHSAAIGAALSSASASRAPMTQRKRPTSAAREMGLEDCICRAEEQAAHRRRGMREQRVCATCAGSRLERPFTGRIHYMFCRDDSHVACTGGSANNEDGQVIGMIATHCPEAAIVYMTTVNKCIEMWYQFGCFLD